MIASVAGPTASCLPNPSATYPGFGFDAVATSAVPPTVSVARSIVSSRPLSQMTSVGARISSCVVIEPVKSSVVGSIVSSTSLRTGRAIAGSRSSGGVGGAAGTATGAAATGASSGVVGAGAGLEPQALAATETATARREVRMAGP